jgi:hypothetical protein
MKSYLEIITKRLDIIEQENKELKENSKKIEEEKEKEKAKNINNETSKIN